MLNITEITTISSRVRQEKEAQDQKELDVKVAAGYPAFMEKVERQIVDAANSGRSNTRVYYTNNRAGFNTALKVVQELRSLKFSAYIKPSEDFIDIAWPYAQPQL